MKILLKVLVVGMIGAILVCLTPVQSQNTSITPITTVGGGSGSAPTGAAGGALSGTYPNPQIASGANITNANLVTPTIGVAKGTSAALTNGLTASTVTGTNSGTFGSATINTNFTVNGQSGFAGFACANLPTGVAVGYQTYCTDCLTPTGTGDRVEWDGSNWTTLRLRILATNDFTAYMLGAASNVVNITTPKSIIYFLGSGTTLLTASGPFTSLTSGGTTTPPTINSFNTNGAVYALAAGSSNNASRVAAIFLPALSAGDNYECGLRTGANTDSNGTDDYIQWIGFASTVTTNYPVEGAFFLRDKSNATGHNQSYTNDWIKVTAKASSYSYSDSGLALSTTITALDKLKVILTTASATFLTNDVAAGSAIATTIPTATLYAVNFEVLKIRGSTTITAYTQSPQFNIRWATPRSN